MGKASAIAKTAHGVTRLSYVLLLVAGSGAAADLPEGGLVLGGLVTPSKWLTSRASVPAPLISPRMNLGSIHARAAGGPRMSTRARDMEPVRELRRL